MLLTTHYMDEVEALADRVAVLFGQEIVASGTPSSIGGRDLGAVTIRFRLPDGVSLESTSRPCRTVGSASGDGLVEIHTEDELRVLHDLTGWALAGGFSLPGLSVLRVSLEDIYLGLTDEDGRTTRQRLPCGDRRAGGATMSTTELPVKGSFRGVSDLPLVARQVRFEQLSFWLNPIGAVLTIAFSVVFIVIFLSTSGHSTVTPPWTSTSATTTSRLLPPTASCPPASASWPSVWSTGERWGC